MSDQSQSSNSGRKNGAMYHGGLSGKIFLTWLPCLMLLVALLGCKTYDIIPKVTIKEPKLPVPPKEVSVVFNRPLPTIDEVFAMSAHESYSNDTFKIKPGEKLAVALFVSPESKDITGRVATDILYLNLEKNKVVTVERQSLAVLMNEQSLMKNESTELSRKQISQMIDRIKNTKYYVVGTIGARSSEQVTINLNYWYDLKYLAAYNREAERVNKGIIRYNNQLYPIIKDTIWPLNAQIQLHNFAVLYLALKDKEFQKLIEYKDKSESKEPTEYEKALKYFRRLRQSFGWSLPYKFDRKYPSLENLIGEKTFDLSQQAIILRERANNLRNACRMLPEAQKNQLMHEAEILDEKAEIFEKKGAEIFSEKVQFYRNQPLKQLILSNKAKSYYGIKDADGDQPLVIPDVKFYNNQVTYYNELLKQAGLSDFLMKAYSTPPLIPLIKKETTLKKLVGNKNVVTNYTKVELTLRFINTATSEIEWIATASRHSQNVNEALNLAFRKIVEKMMPKHKKTRR